jgi:predicted kinase
LKLKAEQEHEWVKEGYVVGFMTNKGLIMDLDNVTYRKVKWLAQHLCRQYKLEGYIIVLSSPRSYHLIFNRYLQWRVITKILFRQYETLRWAVFQMQSGYLTLRISKKNGENKPKIVFKTGKTDKLIAEYMEIYETFEAY